MIELIPLINSPHIPMYYTLDENKLYNKYFYIRRNKINCEQMMIRVLSSLHSASFIIQLESHNKNKSLIQTYNRCPLELECFLS